MLVEAHATAKEMQKTIGAELFNAIYTFSFVRNPLDRFYSIFYYRKLVGDIDPGISFKKYACSLTKPRFRNIDSPFYKRPYYLPMCDYLMDHDNMLLVNEWFKFEQRNSALEKIREKSGMAFSETHQERGRSLPSYQEFYDSESAACVGNFYKDDFKFFSYNLPE